MFAGLRFLLTSLTVTQCFLYGILQTHDSLCNVLSIREEVLLFEGFIDDVLCWTDGTWSLVGIPDLFFWLLGRESDVRSIVYFLNLLWRFIEDYDILHCRWKLEVTGYSKSTFCLHFCRFDVFLSIAHPDRLRSKDPPQFVCAVDVQSFQRTVFLPFCHESIEVEAGIDPATTLNQLTAQPG